MNKWYCHWRYGGQKCGCNNNHTGALASKLAYSGCKCAVLGIEKLSQVKWSIRRIQCTEPEGQR